MQHFQLVSNISFLSSKRQPSRDTFLLKSPPAEGSLSLRQPSLAPIGNVPTWAPAGETAQHPAQISVLTRGVGVISVAVMKTFHYFFTSLYPTPTPDKTRDFRSTHDVHNPPTLSISNAGCVMESPLPAILRSTSIQTQEHALSCWFLRGLGA